MSARLVRRAPWLALVCLAATLAHAATVRGRIDRVTPNGRFPAAGVAVTVYSRYSGRSAPARTGSDGMYYLQTAPGPAYLEIWTNPDPRVQPTVYPIQVREPVTDVAPIVVP